MWGWHRSNGEEGASATLFIIALTALLGVALLALDAGSLFVSRRGQIADTDAGALAAASKLIEDPCTSDAEFEAEADSYVQANDFTTTINSVTVERDMSLPCYPSGTVAVQTSHPAQLYFAPLFGYDAIDTAVMSRARIGQRQKFPGVRPIAICSQDPAYQAYSTYFRQKHEGIPTARTTYDTTVASLTAAGEIIDVTSDYEPGAEDYVFRINFSRTSPPTSDCFGAPGNWAWLDFNGKPSGTPELEDNLRSGYPGGVSLGAAGPGDEDCDLTDGTSPDLDCHGGPGARATTQGVLENHLYCPASSEPTDPACEVIYVVVYDGGNGKAGVNAEFDLASLVGLVLRGSDVGKGIPGHLDVEFVMEQVSGGPFGAFDPYSTAPLGASLCGTGNFDNCG